MLATSFETRHPSCWPLYRLGVFAKRAPKSVWRGVKTSSRFPGSSGHHKPVGVVFSVIFLSQILVTIPHSGLAPWMRAGAALPGGFSAERALTCFLARRHAALVDLVFRHLTWFWRNSALRRVPKNHVFQVPCQARGERGRGFPESAFRCTL